MRDIGKNRRETDITVISSNLTTLETLVHLPNGKKFFTPILLKIDFLIFIPVNFILSYSL
jgi:hypothetical protein